MSKKLPSLSWRDVLNVLRRQGFWQTGQTGSHIFMTDGRHRVTVPRKKEIKKGTLMSIIRQSELGKEMFLK